MSNFFKKHLRAGDLFFAAVLICSASAAGSAVVEYLNLPEKKVCVGEKAPTGKYELVRVQCKKEA